MFFYWPICPCYTLYIFFVILFFVVAEVAFKSFFYSMHRYVCFNSLFCTAVITNITICNSYMSWQMQFQWINQWKLSLNLSFHTIQFAITFAITITLSTMTFWFLTAVWPFLWMHRITSNISKWFVINMIDLFKDVVTNFSQKYVSCILQGHNNKIPRLSSVSRSIGHHWS